MGKDNRTRRDGKKAAQPSGSKTWIKVAAWAVAIVFLVILAFSLLHTSGILQRNITAVTVGDMKLSALQYNIFYQDNRNSYLMQDYGGYTMADILLSGGGSLSDIDNMDVGDGTGTWGDTFRDATLENIHLVLSLYQDGQAAGHVIGEEYSAAIDSRLESMRSQANSYGTTLAGYITSVYGNNTKADDLRAVYGMSYYAESYGQSLRDAYNISDADIEGYYLENMDSYDCVDYYSYAFPYQTYKYTAPAEGESVPEGDPQSEEEATALTDASKAEALADAQAFLDRVAAGEDFDTVAEAYFDAEEATHEHGEDEEHVFESLLTEKAAISGSSTLTAWLKDPARTEGDREAVDTGSAYSATQFVSRYRNPGRTATVRHILFPMTTTLSDEPTEDEKAIYDTEHDIVLGTAQGVLTQWMTGEATEDSFAELAKEHSSDGNAEEGGIYGPFTESGKLVDNTSVTFVSEFASWPFAEGRQVGDVGTVDTQFGVHLMYLVSYDQPEYYYSIRNQLVSDTYSSDADAAKGKYTQSSSSFGLWICF